MHKRPHSGAVLRHHRSNQLPGGGAAGAAVREIACEHREARAKLGWFARMRTPARLVPRGRGERCVEQLRHRLAELLQRCLEASEGGRERGRSTPRARRCAETLRGREQRASLVVQLVCRIAGVGSHCRPGWHPGASPPMGSNVQSMGRDMGKSPQDVWYHPCRRRPGEAKLGSWISPARARERADHSGEAADVMTAHVASVSRVRSTALSQ
jgi:hypothetical protein